MIQKQKNQKKKTRINSNIKPKINELLREINYVKSITKDILDRYLLKTNAFFTNVLQKIGVQKSGTTTLKDKTLSKILSFVRALKVKPKKGRGKDLYRIDELIKKIEDLLN